jgi:hypothetical protein
VTLSDFRVTPSKKPFRCPILNLLFLHFPMSFCEIQLEKAIIRLLLLYLIKENHTLKLRVRRNP